MMMKNMFLTLCMALALTAQACGNAGGESKPEAAPAPAAADSSAPRATVTLRDFTDVAAATIDGVVHIKTEMTQLTPLYQSFFGFIIQQGVQRQVYNAYGSGVIITSDGYILTNNHVVQDAERITVSLNDRRVLPARLVGNDPYTDLAVIKVEAEDLTYIPFGDSDKARVGEPVLAIGNPLNLTSTVTAGIISAKARNMNIIEGVSGSREGTIESFIQTDAAVNSGNSGGALVNASGELIGVVTAIASRDGNFSGYSFAVPSSLAKKVASDLRQYGRTQRAHLGVHVQEMSEQVAQQVGARDIKGLYVLGVMQRRAAERAGILEGDILLRVAGVEVNTFAELSDELGRFSPGQTVEVDYVRDGRTYTTNATLLNLDGTTDVTRK